MACLPVPRSPRRPRLDRFTSGSDRQQQQHGAYRSGGGKYLYQPSRGIAKQGRRLVHAPPAKTITVSPAGLQPVAVLVDNVGVGITALQPLQALFVVNESTNNLMIFVAK